MDIIMSGNVYICLCRKLCPTVIQCDDTIAQGHPKTHPNHLLEEEKQSHSPTQSSGIHNSLYLLYMHELSANGKRFGVQRP